MCAIGVQSHLPPPLLVEESGREMARCDDYVWLFGVSVVQAPSIASGVGLAPEALFGFASGGA